MAVAATSASRRAHDRARARREEEAQEGAAALRHALLHDLRVRRARHARHRGVERRSGLHLADRARRRVRPPVRARSCPRSGARSRRRAARYEWSKLAFGRFSRGDRGRLLLDHEPALGRWLARVHRHGCVGDDGPPAGHRHRVRRATTSSSSPSSGSRSSSRSRRSRYGKWIPTAGGVHAHRRARLLLDHGDRLRGASTASTGSRRRPRAVERDLPRPRAAPPLQLRRLRAARTAQPRRWSTRSATCPSPSPAARSSACSSTRSRSSASCSCSR